MPECEQCGREFDTERGLHVHQSQVHDGEDLEETEEKPQGFMLQADFWKLATVILAVLLVIMAADMYLFDSHLSEEEATTKAMDYLQENIQGGANATLISTSDTNSSVYQMRVRAMDQNIDMFVTKDGEYLFFNHAEMD